MIQYVRAKVFHQEFKVLFVKIYNQRFSIQILEQWMGKLKHTSMIAASSKNLPP